MNISDFFLKEAKKLYTGEKNDEFYSVVSRSISEKVISKDGDPILELWEICKNGIAILLKLIEYSAHLHVLGSILTDLCL